MERKEIIENRNEDISKWMRKEERKKMQEGRDKIK